jgi:mRNA-degrading endonuclease toxin of MazEF toxin-antitoxin module
MRAGRELHGASIGAPPPGPGSETGVAEARAKRYVEDAGRAYPTRVACRFRGKEAQVVLDQLRTVDVARLVRKMGAVDSATCDRVLAVLAELFAP